MSEPYNGTPFGWAFRIGVGAWRWSLGTVGYTRESAMEIAARYRRDSREPAQVARVWINVPPPPGDSPIDALSIIEHAEELYCDMTDLQIPPDGYIISCDPEDVAELQSALDETWRKWMTGRATAAVFVAEDEAEEVSP